MTPDHLRDTALVKITEYDSNGSVTGKIVNADNYAKGIIETGASTIVDAATPYAVDVIKAIKHDFVLCNIDTSKPLQEIVYGILTKGSMSERHAIGHVLTPECAFLFPSASQMIRAGTSEFNSVVQKIFSPMFLSLCQHFNVPFNGNQEKVSQSILRSYGGLSFADFSICFSRVMSGQYWVDTQHIMVRGINFEFIEGWLDKYCDDRELCREQMYIRTKPDNLPLNYDNDVLPSVVQINQQKANRQNLENQANEIYKEWEMSLYENVLIEQGVKSVKRERTVFTDGFAKRDGSGEVVTKMVAEEQFCSKEDAERVDTYPLQVYKVNAHERILKRFIYGFVCFFDNEGTKAMFEDYADRVRTRYAGEPDIERCLKAEIKTAIVTFKRYLKSANGELLMNEVYRKLHSSASNWEIFTAIKKDVDFYRNFYYNEYLPECVAKKIPRFTFAEYLLSQTLPVYIQHGFKNPFIEIL